MMPVYGSFKSLMKMLYTCYKVLASQVFLNLIECLPTESF